MFDINEIMRQALEAGERAAQQRSEPMEQSREGAEKGAAGEEARKQAVENWQRQVELLGQMSGPDAMTQAGDAQALLQKTMDQAVAAKTPLDMGGMMNQLFGENMSLVSAAMETLAMKKEEDEER